MEDLKKMDLLYEGKYTVDKELGPGGYGTVYLVVDKKITSKL
jgi:serine/threonine protein kinase